MMFQIFALLVLCLVVAKADNMFDESDKYSTPLSEKDMVLGTI